MMLLVVQIVIMVLVVQIRLIVIEVQIVMTALVLGHLSSSASV